MNDHEQPSGATVHSTADVPTPRASRYLQQLCKHFQHKRPATFDERAGHIVFPIGDCHLRASDDTLTLSLEAPDGPRLEQLQDVVGRHLLRFAFREEMRIDWRPA